MTNDNNGEGHWEWYIKKKKADNLWKGQFV